MNIESRIPSPLRGEGDSSEMSVIGLGEETKTNKEDVPPQGSNFMAREVEMRGVRENPHVKKILIALLLAAGPVFCPFLISSTAVPSSGLGGAEENVRKILISTASY
jgi:hypothetical protein